MSSIPTANKPSKSSIEKSKELEELKRDVKTLKDWIQVAFNKLQYDRTLTEEQRAELEKKLPAMEADIEELNQMVIDRFGAV